MVDITPTVPAGRQIIQSYGPGRFRIAGLDYAGSVLVFANFTLPWAVTACDEITLESLAPVIADGAGTEILLVGTGAAMTMLDPVLRDALRVDGVIADAMDTGAACRTFNVLLSEGRPVAAALVALG